MKGMFTNRILFISDDDSYHVISRQLMESGFLIGLPQCRSNANFSFSISARTIAGNCHFFLLDRLNNAHTPNFDFSWFLYPILYLFLSQTDKKPSIQLQLPKYVLFTLATRYRRSRFQFLHGTPKSLITAVD